MASELTESQDTGCEMMNPANERKLSWSDFSELSYDLSKQIHKRGREFRSVNGVFGFRTGGLFVAQELGKHLSLPTVDRLEKNTLVVADRVGEGRLPNSGKGLTAALHVKTQAPVKPKIYIEETDAKIVYPWEKAATAELESGVVQVLNFLGEDPARQGLLDTPRRVIKSWNHIFSGYRVDPQKVLGTQFDEPGTNGVILCKGIEMYSTCEHHILPFFGQATVGYVPRDGKIVGLSKLARLVEVFARRLQNQERLTRQIAEALQEAINPIAVGVVVDAEHFCMRSRGVQKQNSHMVTYHMLGTFKSSLSARREFFKLAEI